MGRNHLKYLNTEIKKTLQVLLLRRCLVTLIFDDNIGLTGIEFLILPPRAKISISYGGEPSGEGFLSLKRL